MSERSSLICAAGNVAAPAWLALQHKGYVVTVVGDAWYAEKDGRRFMADDVLALLGLVAMVEIRGADWAATDDEIDAFLRA
jgi:hypothetical protein